MRDAFIALPTNGQKREVIPALILRTLILFSSPEHPLRHADVVEHLANDYKVNVTEHDAGRIINILIDFKIGLQSKSGYGTWFERERLQQLLSKKTQTGGKEHGTA